MTTTVKLSKKLIIQAYKASKHFNRSASEQIKHWIKIGKVVEENPDLTYDFIKNILIAREEADSKKLEPYQFNEQ